MSATNATSTTASSKGGGGGSSTAVGVPLKLLYEAEGMKVTVETKRGEVYRGLLVSVEDTMNMNLSDALCTSRNGQVSKLTNVYIRGKSIRFVSLPTILQSAPIFHTVTMQKRKWEQSQQQQQQTTNKKRKKE